MYGVTRRRGFTTLVGEVGTGKSTLIHALLEQLDVSMRSAVISHTTLGRDEILMMIAREFQLERRAMVRSHSPQEWQVQAIDEQIRLAEEQLQQTEGAERQEEAGSTPPAGEQRVVSVSKAQNAEQSLTPVGPGRGVKLMLALAFAIVGGVSVAFVMEWLDHSLTTGQEIERHLGIAHLVSIPEQAPHDL